MFIQIIFHLYLPFIIILECLWLTTGLFVFVSFGLTLDIEVNFWHSPKFLDGFSVVMMFFGY